MVLFTEHVGEIPQTALIGRKPVGGKGCRQWRTREFLTADEQSYPLYIVDIESGRGLDSFMKYFRSLMILVGSDG